MLSSKKVKLDFESNKKLENLNSIAVNLFSNPGLNKTKKFNEAKNFVLELTKCLGIEPNSRQPFSFILNSKFRKNAGWFEDHPVMADSKAGEYIKHDNKCPIDINIF